MAEILRESPASGQQTSPSEDIGDVLTSIRRLIAQDSPPESASDPLRHIPLTQDQSRGMAASPVTDASLGQSNAWPSTPSPLILTREKLVDDRPPVAGQALPPAAQPRPAGPLAEDFSPQTSKEDMIMPHSSPQIADAQRPAATPLHLAPRPEAVSGWDEKPTARDLNLFAAQQEDLPEGLPLQGMIRDVIIREMEGELGSRMTRNLRQLIRTEIALALQEATQPR